MMEVWLWLARAWKENFTEPGVLELIGNAQVGRRRHILAGNSDRIEYHVNDGKYCICDLRRL